MEGETMQEKNSTIEVVGGDPAVLEALGLTAKAPPSAPRVNIPRIDPTQELRGSDPHPIVAAFQRDTAQSIAEPGAVWQADSDEAARQRVAAHIPQIEPVKPLRHDFTRTLPRGCIAADRYGKPFIVWPNGHYGYNRESKCSPTYSSYSFGPYTVLREGLTAEQCDAFAEGDRLGVDVAEAGAA
jgi:hypothetical protein